jgi:hypothetical protein
MRCEIIVPLGLDSVFQGQVLRPILNRFGGATVVKAEGCWINDRKDVIREFNRLVVVYVSENLHNADDIYLWFVSLAHDVARLWNQDCVFFAIDNDHYLVDQNGVILNG